MKLSNKFLVSFILLNITFSVHLIAQTSDDLEKMIRGSKTRAALVQNIQKAVVHIKVENKSIFKKITYLDFFKRLSSKNITSGNGLL